MKMKNDDQCHWPHCRDWATMVYLTKPLCDKHKNRAMEWNTENERKPIFEKLGIKQEDNQT